MVRCLAQGHLNTHLGGAGDQTSNLPVTSRPALPSEPHAAPKLTLYFHTWRSVLRLQVAHGRGVMRSHRGAANAEAQSLPHHEGRATPAHHH